MFLVICNEFFIAKSRNLQRIAAGIEAIGSIGKQAAFA